MIVASDFRPGWWARGAHAQSMFPVLFRRCPRVAIRRERLELADGDFLDLDWAGPDAGPVVVILHGLEGSSASKYAAGQMKALAKVGRRCVLMHFRGCSGEPNRLRRGYHSGETRDLDTVIERLRRREPDTPLAALGYSLGGNVLLKWLGESGEGAPVTTAIAVSVPFHLDRCADAIDRGFSRVYQAYLLRRMRASYRRKFAERKDAPFPPARVGRLRSFRVFDEAITAPLHGFAGAADYYARASCAGYLRFVRVPTLVLHAADDPFMTPETVPSEAEIAPAVRLELSRRGGHVGFVTGRWPWRPQYWLETRILAHLERTFGPALASGRVERRRGCTTKGYPVQANED